MGLSRAKRYRGALWTAAALLPVQLLLAGCQGGESGASSAGPAASTASGPATAATDSGPATAATGSGPSAATGSGPAASTGSDPAASTASGPAAVTTLRCRTSGLSASVGPGEAGAGQRAFSVALTNQSGRACFLRGYPGAAFTDAEGGQLGPDPARIAAAPASKVTLAPGESAWAALSYSNPGLTDARTAVPETLLVTPPDGHEPLSVRWEGGKVPVSGRTTLSVTAFASGTGR
ncbi:DUF4232 domain-containing protein [Streptomyces sp. NPDC002644]